MQQPDNALAQLVAQYDQTARTPAEAELAAWRTVTTLLDTLRAEVREQARAIYDTGSDEQTLRAHAVGLVALVDEVRAAHEALRQRLSEQRQNLEDFLLAAIERHLTGAHRLATDPRGEQGVSVPVPGGAVPVHALSPTQYSVL